MSYREFGLFAEFADGMGGSYTIRAHSHKEAIQRTLRTIQHVPESIEAIDRATQETVRFVDGRYEYVADTPRVIRPKLKIGDSIDMDFSSIKSNDSIQPYWRGYKIIAAELSVDQGHDVQSLKLVIRARDCNDR